MTLMFMLFSWILALIFMFLNHPLSLGCVLLMQTIMIAISSGMLSFNFWFSYILFLIMIGGMLILFIYMTSVASNEKFKFSKNLVIFSFSLSAILMVFGMLLDSFLTKMDNKNYDLLNQSINNLNLSMNKYLNFPSSVMMITLMIYLLITLIAIVKIIQSKGGPLRQKF